MRISHSLFPAGLARAALVAALVLQPAFGWAQDTAEPAVAEPVSPAGAAAATGSIPHEGQGQLVNPFVVPPQEREGDHFVKGDDPENTIPTNLDKLTFGYYVMELIDKGVEAFDRKEYDRAAKFFRTLTKIDPNRAIGWSKLCETYQLAGKATEAEEACGQAMQRTGATVPDHARYIELFLNNRPQELTDEEVEVMDRLIAHVRTVPQADLVAAKLECRLGARLEDVERLSRCTQVLNARIPHDPMSISFSWALAIADSDPEAAAQQLARAEAAGLPNDVLDTMRTRGNVLLERGLSPIAKSAIGVLLAAAIVGAAFYFLRKRREVAHA